MRASVCVLGPSARPLQRSDGSLPGGCIIGDRPIDLHLKGFEALGAAVRVEGGNVKVFAPKLTGAVINLRGKFGPTVLGTDNVMMAAVLAEGTTVIEGAAQEPEVVDLATFPEQDGREDRRRRHAADDHRRCHGTARGGARGHSGPIEAGTFLVTGAIVRKGSHGQAGRTGTCASGDQRLTRCGFPDRDRRTMRFRSRLMASTKRARARDRAVSRFPTDMQAQMCALLSTT